MVLKDEQTQLRAVLFKQAALRLPFDPEDGMEVWAHGSLQVYEARGEYQLNISKLEPQGTGALQLAFEQMRERLQREGLFDTEHKRPLPFLPRAIGVVTSAQGAVIQDMRNVLWRRFPGLRMVLFPAVVQGDAAPASLRRGVEWLNEHADELQLDVLIVGRGGGSLEDLWAFNDEALARALFASKLPVISAVGHETDFTIADFVSDVRAPTPSAAMELAVPQRGELVAAVTQQQERLRRAVHANVRQHRRAFENQQQRIHTPKRAIRAYIQQLQSLEERLRQFLRKAAQQRRELQQLEQRLERHAPRRLLRQQQQSLETWTQRLLHAWEAYQNIRKHRLQEQMARLDALSPLSVLQRGYSVTLDPRNQPMQSALQVHVGDVLQLKLPDGTVFSRVEMIQDDSLDAKPS
jgi:exodeoxyribonuclease VII large subunit